MYSCALWVISVLCIQCFYPFSDTFVLTIAYSYFDYLCNFTMCSYCVHRGLPAGIYETYNSNTCRFIADNCKANIIVVENQTQLEKILEVT